MTAVPKRDRGRENDSIASMNLVDADAKPSIADHDILHRIGAGAYGEVWLARSKTGAPRAVKVVRRSRFEHERLFEREFLGLVKFEPVSRLHDALVDVLQVGRDDSQGYFYYVMELADDARDSPAAGDLAEFQPLTLEEVIRRQGRLPVKQCAALGATVAGALSFLHGRSLVHRDVKPSNIIFVGGHAKLADIGLVASLGDARSFVGTDGFIPPEGPGSAKGDLYGLGKTLYEMATGKSRLDFPDLPSELRGTPEAEAFSELNETILRACAADPDQRHESAETLRGELLLLDAGGSIRRLRRNERLMSFWRRVGIAALVLVLAGAAGLHLERKRAKEARETAESEARQRQEIALRELTARQNLYAADMNLAQQALAAGNYGRAESLLANYLAENRGEDLRGIEWFYYWGQVRGDSIATLRGHDDVVSALVASPDGRRLFSASFDQTIREWSIEDGRALRSWTCPGSLFAALAIHPGGRFLAGEGGNRPFSSLLDTESGLWITNVSSASPSVAFSPDGSKLVRGARTLLFDTNGVVEIADSRFEVERTLPDSGGRLAFAPNGKLLATGSWGDSIRVWSWPDLRLEKTLPRAGTVMSLGFSPDGSRLASVNRQGELILWDAASGREAARKQTHGGSVIWAVAFSADGQRLATGGNDQTVRVWNSATLLEQHVYRGHGSEVWAVLWSGDGRRIFSAGKDRTVRVWDAAPREAHPPVKGLVQKPVFSPDERYLAVRSREGAVILEAQNGKTAFALEDAAEIGGFSPDNAAIAILGRDWVFRRHVLASGSSIEQRQLKAPAGSFSKRLLSSDGRWLATGLRNGEVHVHDTSKSSESVVFQGHSQMIVALAFSPDNRRLLTGSMDRSARLWDLGSGKVLRVFQNHRMAVGAVSFSPDGSRIATGSWDDTVHVWDAATGEELMILGGHEAGVQAVDFAPDNRTLVSLSGTSALRFWSVPAQREAGTVQLASGVHQAWVAVSPNGRWLAAVSQAEDLAILAAPRELSVRPRP